MRNTPYYLAIALVLILLMTVPISTQASECYNTWTDYHEVGYNDVAVFDIPLSDALSCCQIEQWNSIRVEANVTYSVWAVHVFENVTVLDQDHVYLVPAEAFLEQRVSDGEIRPPAVTLEFTGHVNRSVHLVAVTQAAYISIGIIPYHPNDELMLEDDLAYLYTRVSVAANISIRDIHTEYEYPVWRDPPPCNTGSDSMDLICTSIMLILCLWALCVRPWMRRGR